MVTDKDLEMGSIYPPQTSIMQCSVKIATRLVEYAYKTGKTNRKSNVSLLNIFLM